MNETQEKLPTDPRRVRAFASFFKNYMSVSAIVVAALPVPLTAFNALPTFADHKSALSTYTSLFCFLTLGFIFYMRHSLARWMFPLATGDTAPPQGRRSLRALIMGIMPFLLILTSGYLFYLYHLYLDQAVAEIARGLATPRSGAETLKCYELEPMQMVKSCEVLSPQEVLARHYPEIPGGFWLRPLYVGMFVAAEAAFILMATREYIQDLLSLSDLEVIRGSRMASERG